jgi:ABC-type transporter Mla maintaining outer membrane lipid asymmetry ATPase subunit MlaF
MSSSRDWCQTVWLGVGEGSEVGLVGGSGIGKVDLE